MSSKKRQTWSDWNDSWGIPLYVFGGMGGFIGLTLLVDWLACGRTFC